MFEVPRETSPARCNADAYLTTALDIIILYLDLAIDKTIITLPTVIVRYIIIRPSGVTMEIDYKPFRIFPTKAFQNKQISTCPF